MQHRTFGRLTGLRVSEYALGAGNFGTRWGTGAEPAEAQRIFERFADAGGTVIDTAESYQLGESETLLGDFLAADRDHFVVATKYSNGVAKPEMATTGNGRRNMIRAVEGSLKRLKTDRIDLYWVHFQDGVTPIEEILRGLDDLVSSGKILHAGLSNFPAWRVSRAQTIAELRGWSPIAGIQVEYSLVERTADRELLPMAEALGLGVTLWSPLGGGLLTGKYRLTDEGRLTRWTAARPHRGPRAEDAHGRRGPDGRARARRAARRRWRWRGCATVTRARPRAWSRSSGRATSPSSRTTSPRSTSRSAASRRIASTRVSAPEPRRPARCHRERPRRRPGRRRHALHTADHPGGMRRTSFADAECPIALGLEAVGEWWTILILRDVFDGFTRFDELQRNLQISPSMLARRLTALTDAGLLERRRYSERPPRDEYVLTERGAAFRPVLHAIYAWSEEHVTDHAGKLALVDRTTGEPIDPIVVDRATGTPLEQLDVGFTAGPNAGAGIRARYAVTDG